MNQDKKDMLGKLENSGTGFNLPKGYFDSLEDKISAGIKPDELSEKIKGPRIFQKDSKQVEGLSKIRQQSGFKVPEGYFEKDEAYLIGSPKKRTFPLSLNRNTKVIWYSIAASFLLFFTIKYVTVRPTDFDFSEINQSEIETWIDADLVSFNSYDVAEVFDDVNLDDYDFTDEEVENYIANEDIENIILQNETNE